MNKIIAIIVAVAVLAAAAIVLLVTAGAVSPDFVPVDWLEVPLERASDATGGSLITIIVVSVLLLVGALLVLVLEFSRRGREDELLISSSEAGSATVDHDSVRLLAERAASGASSVRQVRCWVKHKPDGLLISCRALSVMGSNIPEVSAEIQGNIRETVSEYTGLSVADVRVTVKYERVDRKHAMVR